MEQAVQRRTTKYTDRVIAILRQLQHATNAEIAAALRHDYPRVSATTVHRITQRLQADGVIGLAPATEHGCLRYDSNPVPHDHFVCSSCDGLHDITIAPALRRELARQVVDCLVDGPLIITGTCHPCHHDNHNS